MKTENGMLKKYKLGELCNQDEIGIYGIPATAEEFSEEKIRYLRITDISDDGILLDDDKKSVSDDNIEKYILQEGDIVFARTGNSTGRAYLYDKKDGILAFAGFLIKYGLDKNKVNPKFLRYYTIGNTYKQWVKNLSVGSTRGNISAKTFAECPISLPDRKQQDFTVDVLSALDDKIALTRRINAKLEQLAKRLYDHWFVQFDFSNENGKPYKASGGKMEYNEVLKREIPAGWEVGNLYDIAEYVNGLACQNYRPKAEEAFLPVIKIREMNEGISSDTEKVSANIPEKYKIFDGDILFSWSASLEVMIWAGGDGGLNQHIFKVNPKSYFSKEYIYQQLQSYLINFQKMAEARKTTMGHITSDHINQSRVLLPPKEIISAFNEKTLSIFNYQLSIEKETQKLTALRDRLLPLLMNGQVEVK